MRSEKKMYFKRQTVRLFFLPLKKRKWQSNRSRDEKRIRKLTIVNLKIAHKCVM